MSDTAFLEELLTPLKIHFQNHEVRHIDINEPGEYFVRFLDERTEHHKDETLTFEWGKNLIKYLCAYWRAPFDPEAQKYEFVLPFGGRLHALFGNHCSTGMGMAFRAPSSGWPTPFRIEPIPKEMETPPDQQYTHHLIDALFQIRAQAANGRTPTGARLDMLSGMATDIVFEILWSQAHWAIRNELKLPQGKNKKLTIDDERLHLIKWLTLFANASFIYPNASTLQKISEEGAHHFANIRLGKRHRYDQVAKKGEKGLADVKITTFKQVLEEMNTLIKEGIPERQATRLAREATNLDGPKFSKLKKKTFNIYADDSKLRYMSWGRGGITGEPRQAVPLITDPSSIPRKDIGQRVCELMKSDTSLFSACAINNAPVIQSSIIRLLEVSADFRKLLTSSDIAVDATSAKRRNSRRSYKHKE